MFYFSSSLKFVSNNFVSSTVSIWILENFYSEFFQVAHSTVSESMLFILLESVASFNAPINASRLSPPVILVRPFLEIECFAIITTTAYKFFQFPILLCVAYLPHSWRCTIRVMLKTCLLTQLSRLENRIAAPCDRVWM